MSSAFGSSVSEFFCATKTIDLSDFITSSNAFIDFFLPTNSGAIIDGNITISLSGSNGFVSSDIIKYNMAT